ncbi:MAG TPA: YusW family protein [Bacteroidales bacterium]|nr:YusW family protein [Bacteroidales bacterium]
MQNLIVIDEGDDEMENRPDLDTRMTIDNLEMPQVTMPGHKEQLKLMLLAHGSPESRRSGSFISSALNKTIGVIMLKKSALRIAVPVMLLLMAVVAYQSLIARPQAVAAVTLQVNPAVTLTLDQKNVVLEAVGENADGVAFVADFQLKGKELKEALEEFTQRLHDEGFLHPDSEVIITVHPLAGSEQASLKALSAYAQQVMSDNLNRYNVQKPDSYVISEGLHLFLRELGLMPLNYVELLKANLTEEEIIQVVNALGRKDTATASLPYVEFDLEIDYDERELSVDFEQKNYGIYAKVELQNDDNDDIELEGKAALDYLLPILEKLEINATMSKSVVVEKVLVAFAWQGPYEEFELKVRFADGSYIDFEWEDDESHNPGIPDVAAFAFKEFDLEVESDDHALSVEFEVKNGVYYADVEIEQNGQETELEGSAALDYLLPILEKLTIDTSMSRQQIVDRVLAAFNWTYTYDEFEIEVEFVDGTSIDFEIGD